MRAAWVANFAAYGLGAILNFLYEDLVVGLGRDHREFNFVLGTVFLAQTIAFYAFARAPKGYVPVEYACFEGNDKNILLMTNTDITGIRALKRRIEHRTEHEGTEATDVKTGRGGIRDVEFVIQFLQLLNGGDLPELRQRNTLLAMQSLAKTGCLTPTECHILEDAYRFLRKTEHRLQMLFDLQTHRLPPSPDEQRKLALRMGYTESDSRSALEAFLKDYREKTDLNRKILDHLLHL